MTTSQLRIEAEKAEAMLNWSKAADLYAQAVAVYPAFGPGNALAIADVARLQKRADGCRAAAQDASSTDTADDFNSVSSHHHY